jgi:hypothetical protein
VKAQGRHDIKELQKTAISGSSHATKSTNVKVQVVYHGN